MLNIDYSYLSCGLNVFWLFFFFTFFLSSLLSGCLPFYQFCSRPYGYLFNGARLVLLDRYFCCTAMLALFLAVRTFSSLRFFVPHLCRGHSHHISLHSDSQNKLTLSFVRLCEKKKKVKRECEEF